MDLLRPGSHSGGLQSHAVFMGGVGPASVVGGGKRVFGGIPAGYSEGVGGSSSPSTVGDGDSDLEPDSAEGYRRNSARSDDGAAPPAFLRPLLGEDAEEGTLGEDAAEREPGADLKELDHYEVPPSPCSGVCGGVCMCEVSVRLRLCKVRL